MSANNRGGGREMDGCVRVWRVCFASAWAPALFVCPDGDPAACERRRGAQDGRGVPTHPAPPPNQSLPACGAQPRRVPCSLV